MDDRKLTTDEHIEFAREILFSAEIMPAKAVKPRQRKDPGIRALAAFSRVLETQTPNAQRAAILWLADRYLGMKPRHWIL